LALNPVALQSNPHWPATQLAVPCAGAALHCTQLGPQALTSVWEGCLAEQAPHLPALQISLPGPQLLGQSRVFYAMSHDGLVPKVFSEVHPKYGTPWKSNLIFFVFVGAFAAFLPEDIVGEMTSIGTLFAFVLVCAGVWILRGTRPDLERPFRTPLMPFVPIMGILCCFGLMMTLPADTWLRLIVWLLIGFVIYFGYGRRNSILQRQLAAGTAPK